MKKTFIRRFSALLLSCLLLAMYVPTASVFAEKASAEADLRTAFEVYVASTVFKDNGMSSTYSDTNLKDALTVNGFDGVEVKDSYIKHAKAGFEIATDTLDGYEDGYLFEPEDGYVSALLTYGEVTVGCIADIPAYTYKNTDINTVSKDSEFTVQDGVITAYNGNAEILVLNNKVSKDWTIANAENVKVIIVKSGQSFTASDSGVFSGTKLPNLKAIRFESAGFAYDGDVKLFGNASQLTHVGLPVNGVYMLPHHFLNGISSVVVLENTEKVERLGWQALYGTAISEISFGKERGEIYIRNLALCPTAAIKAGVTPVFNLLHTTISGNSSIDEGNTKISSGSIVYANKAVIDVMNQYPKEYGKATLKDDSDNGLFKAAVSVKAKINSMTEIVADSVTSAKALGSGLSDTYTVEWDSFNTDNGRVTGLISVGNGTDSVKFKVDMAGKPISDDISAAFEKYVASTVRKSDGMSSTYSDAGLKEYLADEGFADVEVNSYIKHSKAGFGIATDILDGYKDGYLFEPEDGYVSALLTYGEVTVGCIADIPAYTYVNTDIDTVSKDSEFTVQDGVITAYNGNAEILVLNNKVSKDWTIANADNVKAIIVKSGQAFAAADSGVFSGTKLPNLKAIRFESADFATGDDVKLFGNASTLTHVGLPVNGVYMLPNHFLNGISSVVVLENSEKVQRVGWQAIYGTSISELSFGREADEIYIDAFALMPTVAVNAGVTPVFNLLHNGKSMSGTGGNDKKFIADSIVYANEKVITLMKDATSCNNAVYKKDGDNGLFKTAGDLKARAALLTRFLPTSGGILRMIGTAPEGYTFGVNDTVTNDGKVSGILCVSNGTDTVEFNFEKTAIVLGDLNTDGEAATDDLVIIKKAVLGIDVDYDFYAADCHADDKIDILDLIALKKICAGI